MSKVSEVNELISTKNEALEIAIKALGCFMVPCNDRDCEPNSEPPYHWRGCETNVQPIIDGLRLAVKAQ
jgi:hypothetical protein